MIAARFVVVFASCVVSITPARMAAAQDKSIPAPPSTLPATPAPDNSKPKTPKPGKLVEGGEKTGDAYYLPKCAECGEKLGAKGEPSICTFAGREVRFCGKECREKFEAAGQPSLDKLDQVMIADQMPHYPLDTSVVSGKTLGDKPIDYIWHNRLVRLADASEKKDFDRDSKKYIGELDKAVVAKQSAGYRLSKCPIMGDPVKAGEAKVIVVANRMIRLCCNKCVGKVRANPITSVAAVDSGMGAADATDKPSDTKPPKRGASR